MANKTLLENINLKKRLFQFLAIVALLIVAAVANFVFDQMINPAVQSSAGVDQVNAKSDMTAAMSRSGGMINVVKDLTMLAVFVVVLFMIFKSDVVALIKHVQDKE